MPYLSDKATFFVGSGIQRQSPGESCSTERNNCPVLAVYSCFILTCLLLEPLYSKAVRADEVENHTQEMSADRGKQHTFWKGRRTLPLPETRALLRRICTELSIPTESGTRFLLEIAAAESDFGYYVRQVKGPALSVWQIEPATARDMHERLPKRNYDLYRKIIALREPTLSEEENIVTNLDYGAAMCIGVLTLKGVNFGRLESLPIRARVWKKVYNTWQGRGTLEGYMQKAMKYTGAVLNPEEALVTPFDEEALIREDLLASRNRERYLLLPENFDQSEVGRHYRAILKENPMLFEEVPDCVLLSRNVRSIAASFTLELVRIVQRDPERVGEFSRFPQEILRTVALAAMHENAPLSYPRLPPALQADPEMKRIFEIQLFLRGHSGAGTRP